MGRLYHDGMSVPRQEDPGSSPEAGQHEQQHGRVNQKRRTRAALVDAAKALLADGITPTVPQAAAAALVSRTTAYRYFPSQEALLTEVAVNTDVDDLEALVAAPHDDAEQAAARTLELLEALNRHVLDAEVPYRAALRLYLDQWLAAAAEGDDDPVVREGRRTRWFTRTLGPLRDDLGDERFERTVSALALLAGAEPVVVLRDVDHLRGDEAVDVARWAAEAVLTTAVREAEAETGA